MTLDQEDHGFGFLGLTLGPALVLLGLILPFFSIFSSGINFRNQTGFQKLNRLTGWLVFTLALTVYVFTLEPTTSFWDCGEFIASAYKLQVPHPPGAPLFLLVGRMFSLLALGDVKQVAYWVNMVSALSSAFTVLFLFWTITLLARKLVEEKAEKVSPLQTILILSSGVVGALSFTFSDSFWFSTVEAEVYALSSFFTAIVFWAMLKWETAEKKETGSRWLLLIAYLLGLSIGVHLLNLLAIPAMALIYFHRNFRFTYKGALLTLLISLGIIGLIMWGIIPGLPAVAGSLEVFFVNAFGLPFGSGILVFLLLFIAFLVYALKRSITKRNALWQTALLGLVYILIGYSSYLIIPIRSAYNPPVDENNPEEILSFVSYLRREQYGERPLLYGPQFSAELIDQQRGAPQYARVKDRYEVVDHKVEPVYKPKDLSLLPRLYSNSPLHLYEYKKWVNIREGEKPTMSQNLSFLFRYQLGHMYGRYFLWNFAGRESDVQHAGVLWPWEKPDDLPHEIQTNKARNNYYLLPLLLGLAGAVYQFRQRKPDAVVVSLLFLFTGVAIAFYLNQPPAEPRERDYAFAGSFYAFAIWIGLGVMALAALLKKYFQNPFLTVSAAACCLAVPMLMAQQGWDDHDRSDRYYAVDFARNMLESCAPNAILFTNGDNDTFPLWYAQEVEGLRRDVRVVVLSYLNTDWYIEQMKRPAYESAPLPISLEEEDFKFSANNYLPYVARPQVANGIDLKQFIKLVKQNHEALQVTANDGRTFLSMPTKNFFLEVNKAVVLQSGIIPKERGKEVVSQMRWSFSGSGMEKKQLLIADILATNNWQQPIYFSTSANAEDVKFLKPYLQLEGLTYRVLPALNPDPQAETAIARNLMYQNLTQKFQFRNLHNPDIHYDNVYQSQLVTNMREKFGLLALEFLKHGETAKAKTVTALALKVLPDAAHPYDLYAPLYVELLARTGQQEKADQLIKTVGERAKKSVTYYAGLEKSQLFDREIQLNMLLLQNLIRSAYNLNNAEQAKGLEAFFMEQYQKFKWG
ncbi:DUF2723 domain-containing protein [Adhaeribacter soli]|uniref:DUF2723 domain-containing protein n=2 Tax=Adhaeribacter soli TaxID=2607655 RepID=A0A5N1IJ70_9BACT|nr:DUF2723 domain-containing protein [Adhaeribacter soli]